MTRNEARPSQGTNNPALDDVRPLDVPLPSPTTLPRVPMPTRYDSRLARDRINMGYLASAKGDPRHPEMIKCDLSMKLFPPEKDVMMNGEWMVNCTTASIMDNDYEEVEALAVIPSMYRDEKLKAKGKRAPWPAYVSAHQFPFFGKSCTKLAVAMSEEWDTARTIWIAIDEMGAACTMYYRWMMDDRGAKSVLDCPICLKSSDDWPLTMDHVIFQHTSEQIHRLPFQAHNYLGLKVLHYYETPAGRPWVPAHKKFLDESIDRYRADDRSKEIEKAQRLERD